jgi:flagellar basal-body rod protein FlgC
MITLLNGIQNTSAALNAERVRMEVVSQNIANAHVTRGPDGRPYQRQLVVFESLLRQTQDALGAGNAAARGVQVSRIVPDQSPPRLVHNPAHPDADAQGMVAMPNINIHEEMVDLMAASRAYEANLAAIKTARAMALQTLAIGKR